MTAEVVSTRFPPMTVPALSDDHYHDALGDEMVPSLSLADLSVPIVQPSAMSNRDDCVEVDDDLGEMDAEARARYELYLRSKTDNFIRMDITAGMFRSWADWQRADFIKALPNNKTVKTIHLSGQGLDKLLSKEQIEDLIINGIGCLEHLQELFIFKGGCITEETVAKCLSNAVHVKLLMMWQFPDMCSHPGLAAAVRMHPSLERLTINLPIRKSKEWEWGCLDLFVMAVAGMPKLRVLQIRCDTKQRQRESIISPDALTLLMNSKSIQSLYLENVGLVDEHVDCIADEVTLVDNQVLTTLDLKDNLFSDDVLYTFGRMLPKNRTLQCLDLSGVYITEAGGKALAAGIVHANLNLLHLDLEGVEENYINEFDIPVGHSKDDWMMDIKYQLRINRAYHAAINGGLETFSSDIAKQKVTVNRINALSKEQVVDAVIHVADQMGCSYYLLRKHIDVLFG